LRKAAEEGSCPIIRFPLCSRLGNKHIKIPAEFAGLARGSPHASPRLMWLSDA